METVMFTAQSSGAPAPGGDDTSRPVSAEEIWNFVAYGITCA
jgi:hypothetical protein